MNDSPIEKAIKMRKTKLMKLLGMKEWGVLNFASLNKKDNKMAWKLFSEINSLETSKMIFDDMEKTIEENSKLVMKQLKKSLESEEQ